MFNSFKDKYDSILSLLKQDLMHGTSLGRQVKIGFFSANFQLNFAKNVTDGFKQTTTRILN